MELKKKECYHKNVQKITRTAGTWPYCKPHPQRVPVVIIFYIRSEELKMQKIELKFDQPEEIIDFVAIMNRYECDADVKYGSMVVDAKSIVGVLSLARSKTVEVILHTDECQNLLDEIAQFCSIIQKYC